MCFGRVAGEPTLQTATLASAAGRELADRLGRGDSPVSALAATAKLFPLEVATVLGWLPATPVVTRTDWAAGELRKTEHPLGLSGELQVHHHLPPKAAAAVEVYLKRFPTHPSGTCASDLVALAGSGNSAIVVLQGK